MGPDSNKLSIKRWFWDNWQNMNMDREFFDDDKLWLKYYKNNKKLADDNNMVGMLKKSLPQK